MIFPPELPCKTWDGGHQQPREPPRQGLPSPQAGAQGEFGFHHLFILLAMVMTTVGLSGVRCHHLHHHHRHHRHHLAHQVLCLTVIILSVAGAATSSDPGSAQVSNHHHHHHHQGHRHHRHYNTNYLSNKEQSSHLVPSLSSTLILQLGKSFLIQCNNDQT